MKNSKMFLILSLATILAVLSFTLPVMPAMAQTPSLSISPAAGSPGTTVTISGNGFAAGASYSIVRSLGVMEQGYPGNTSVVSGAAINGSFTTTYSIPSIPRGTYVFLDQISGASVNYDVQAALYIGSTIGKVGDTITIGGRGFGRNTAQNTVTVNIYYDNTAVKQPVTDNSGNFSSSLTIPESAQGNHTVYATDAFGSTPQNIFFTVNPNLTVNPANAAIGAQVAVAGTGFTAGSSVSFTLDGTNIGTTASASTLGSFSDVMVTIPTVASGSHSLNATDNNAKSASTTVTTSQSMTSGPVSGPAGTTITISGNGFVASKNISVTFKDAAITTDPAAVVSDASGNFTLKIAAPKMSSGTYEIKVSDGANSSTAKFTVQSTAKIGLTTGPIGSSVPVSGEGFNSGTLITVKYDNATVATTNADPTGSFTATFKVPPGAAGQHEVVVTDGITPYPAFKFTATSTTQIAGGGGPGTQISGYVGSDVSLSGSGYTPGATVTVKYDSTQITTAKVGTDGAFSATFKAPASKGGNHTITTSEGANNATFTFAMDSTPPPAPNLAPLPKDANLPAIANFEWTPVTDPSGVTYIMQISLDAGFNSTVLQKTVAGTSYQLTEQEKLKDAGSSKPYYWRVRAIDGASNEGPWSSAKSFTVGYITPSWIMYFIYAVAAIILFAIGFFVGRRTRRNAL
jgi:hypothetical protein